MSFSSDVKDELSWKVNSARHCQIAEIAAIISLCGRIQIHECMGKHTVHPDVPILENNHYCIKVHTENVAVARKYFTLLKMAFDISAEISIRQGSKNRTSKVYTVGVHSHQDAIRVLMASKLMDTSGEIEENLSLSQNVVIQKSCCKRAFLRGAFLAAGSMSDPKRFYHYEIACISFAKAEQLQNLMRAFALDAHIVRRRKYYVVYMKEGNQIVDVLGVMGAHRSLMELENIRILKEMRGSVNRKVNCETANIHKTVSAAVRQTEDIIYIRDTIGFGGLPKNLREVAQIRLERPEATLKELGEALYPAVGKSGVNHRLRKLGQIAQQLRSRSDIEPVKNCE